VGRAGFLDVKTDFPARFDGRSGKFADGVEQGFDGLVVTFKAPFKYGQSSGQSIVRSQHPPQAHECAHDKAPVVTP
jgi:hypothetical protein